MRFSDSRLTSCSFTALDQLLEGSINRKHVTENTTTSFISSAPGPLMRFNLGLQTALLLRRVPSVGRRDFEKLAHLG